VGVQAEMGCERQRGSSSHADNYQDCQQKYGVDYWETYPPAVAQEAVKLILLLALHLGLRDRHVKFVTSFVNGPIDNDVEIVMEMPEYFDDGSGRVCRLLGSFYGLNQAAVRLPPDQDERRDLHALGGRRLMICGSVCE
jgi:hypothetical protein